MEKISRSGYSDKDLIRRIAEIAKEERIPGKKTEQAETGSEPRCLVEDVFGVPINKQDRSTQEITRLFTRVNKAIQNLKKILGDLAAERCVAEGPPEFAIIHAFLRDEAPNEASLNDLTNQLARKLKKLPADVALLIKEFARHWVRWFTDLERYQCQDLKGRQPPTPLRGLEK